MLQTQLVNHMKNGVNPNLFTKVTFIALLSLCSFAVAGQNQVAKQSPGGTWFLEYLPPDYATKRKSTEVDSGKVYSQIGLAVLNYFVNISNWPSAIA